MSNAGRDSVANSRAKSSITMTFTHDQKLQVYPPPKP